MLTTAGPYFCTIELKSGRTAAGLPVAGTGVTGAGAVTAARAATLTAYRTLTGAATNAAPSTAAMSGFRIRAFAFMSQVLHRSGFVPAFTAPRIRGET